MADTTKRAFWYSAEAALIEKELSKVFGGKHTNRIRRVRRFRGRAFNSITDVREKSKYEDAIFLGIGTIEDIM